MITKIEKHCLFLSTKCGSGTGEQSNVTLSACDNSPIVQAGTFLNNNAVPS